MKTTSITVLFNQIVEIEMAPITPKNGGPYHQILKNYLPLNSITSQLRHQSRLGFTYRLNFD